jgi:hypothetical protein
MFARITCLEWDHFEVWSPGVLPQRPRQADSLINSGNPHYGPYWDVAAVDCGYMSKDMSVKILSVYAAIHPTAPEKDTLRRIATF